MYHDRIRVNFPWDQLRRISRYLHPHVKKNTRTGQVEHHTPREFSMQHMSFSSLYNSSSTAVGATLTGPQNSSTGNRLVLYFEVAGIDYTRYVVEDSEYVWDGRGEGRQLTALLSLGGRPVAI